MKEASQLTKGNLKFLSGAWTAPSWMKDHNSYIGYSMLNEKYGRVYAEYLKKFLDEYKSRGFPMWGITTGSNPLYGFEGRPNSMGWLPEAQV